jgi:site-specific DNA-methyltransferase (adenine-specific)
METGIIKKQRSPRNRTLQMSGEEMRMLRGRLLTLSVPADVAGIINRTVLGDLFVAVDYLPSEFVDLMIVDPPYNLTRNFAGMKFRRMKDGDYSDYLESWFPKMMRLLKPNASLYLCGDWQCTSALYGVMSKYMTVMNRITWQREKGRAAARNWKNCMEDIWFGVCNPKDYYFNPEAVKIRRKVLAPYRQDGLPKDWEDTGEGKFRMTFPSNFWNDITVPYWSMPENTNHPTQKPEKLFAKLILASSPENGMIFDPFLGAGTSSVVAKKLGRNYCGIEINPLYACWTEKRLERAGKDKTIQGVCNGVFWERNSKPA